MTEYITDRRRQILLFVVMAMAFFLDGLDGTIVTIALPDMGESFHMSTGDASWIVTVYFMVMAGLILVFGKLADRGAIRGILAWGFVIFAISSLGCALAADLAMLLLFRAVQGVGSAMLAATGIMLVVKFLPPSIRYFGMSLSVLGSSVGSAIGPVLGGVLTEMLSWHWIFLINVPIGIVCAILTVRVVPKDSKNEGTKLDRIGSLLLFSGLVSGLYAMESLPSHGVTVYSAAALVLCIVLMSAFVLYEKRCSDPVVDIGLFRISKFDLASIAFLLTNACFLGLLYLVPFLMKVEMGLDTLIAGAFMLIQAAVTLVMCLPVGRACDTNGTHRYAVAGCLCLMLTFAIFMFVNEQTGVGMLALGLAVLGMVWGFCGSSLGPRMVEFSPDARSGSASAMLSFLIYFGNALGTVMFAALFNVGSGSSGTDISELSADMFMDGFVFAMAAGLAIAALCTAISYHLKPDHE